MTQIAEPFRQSLAIPVYHRSPVIAQESRLALLFVVFFFVILNVQIFSTIIPLAIIAVALVFTVLYHRQLYYFLLKKWIVLAFPAVVLLSATWSDIPSESLWYGTQLCVTIAIGLLVGVSATQRQLLLGVFIAMAIVTLLSIAWGRTGDSASGPVLIGVTGSKDQMGFVALTLLASGMGLLFDQHRPITLRVVALCLIPVGAYIATHVEAAAAMVGAACAVVGFLGFFFLRYFHLPGRVALVAVALLVLVPASLIAVSQFGRNGEDTMLQALQKDRTLTGRTIIWDIADHWIEQEPLIGHGYRSFWLGNSIESNGLLHHFGITDGRTFQFHETYKEILVDTGWVGLIALMIAGIPFLVYILANAFLNPGAPSAFIASMYLLLIARSPLETIILTFYPYTVLFYACGAAAIVHFMNKTTVMKPQAVPIRNVDPLRRSPPNVRMSALPSNITPKSPKGPYS